MSIEADPKAIEASASCSALPSPIPATSAEKSGLKEQVWKGGAFMMVRQIVSMSLSLVGVLVITRVLGPARYGSYAAALGVYEYIQALGQVGIGVYLVRSLVPPPERDYHVASTLLLLLALLLIALVSAAKAPLSAWINVDGFSGLLSVLLLALPFQTLAVAASARLDRALDFRRVAMIEVGGQLVYYLTVLPLIFFSHYGAWSLAIGWCAQQIALCIALHAAAAYWPRFVLDRPVIMKIIGYTLGFSAANWLYQLRYLVNPLIVGHYLGKEAVGLVGIGIRLLELLSFAKTVAWRLSVAALARVQDNSAKLVDAITHGMQLQMLAIAPILLGFSWFGGFLLPLVFGKRWLPVMDVYPFLALSYLTNAQFNVHSSVLYVRQRNWDVAIFHIVHVGLFALGTWFAVQRLGLVGYGWGEVAGLGGYAVLYWKIAREIGQPDYRISALWWTATTIGLFWQQLGYWAIAVPFAALLWPRSLRELKTYVVLVRRGGRAVA